MIKNSGHKLKYLNTLNCYGDFEDLYKYWGNYLPSNKRTRNQNAAFEFFIFRVTIWNMHEKFTMADIFIKIWRKLHLQHLGENQIGN